TGLAGQLLGALVAAGAFAAFLSSASGLLTSVAGVLSTDVIGRSHSGSASPRSELASTAGRSQSTFASQRSELASTAGRSQSTSVRDFRIAALAAGAGAVGLGVS